MSGLPEPLPRAAITTSRLLLEPVRAGAAPAAQRVIEASQAEFSRWFRWAGDPSLATTQEYFAGSEAQWNDGTAYHFTIHLEDELIGSIGMRLSAMYPFEARVGYWLGTAWAGRGYMSEAAAALRDAGFQQTGLRRLELTAGVENLGSQRVAEKIGMRREGLSRGTAWDGGGDAYDAYRYAMLRDDPRRDTGERYSGERAEAAITAPDFSHGLVTAVAQDDAGEVLMVAHMNEEAYRLTLKTGHAWFWSRSRERLWEKGETSGDYLDVRSVTLDCDGDAVLLRVSPHGPACHTGARSCFHNPVR